jgi:hypothetical protein
MRISYILGFLLALSLPAAAAEPDQNLKQEIGKVASAYEQNFNKKDAAGITSSLLSRRGVVIRTVINGLTFDGAPAFTPYPSNL